MKGTVLEQLRAVAVADEGRDGTVSWHPAQVVFEREGAPPQYLIARLYAQDESHPETEVVVGSEHDADWFDQAVAEGMFRCIGPLEVPSFHRVVCGLGGAVEVVHRDDLRARRNKALRARLRDALQRMLRGKAREDIAEAWEEAHDVDPWSLLGNLLRCGWHVTVESDADDTLEDLLAVEPNPAAFRRVSSLALTRDLEDAFGARGKQTLERLFQAARDAAERLLKPEFVLANPVPESLRLRATLLGLLRRQWAFMQPVTFEHDLLAGALRGHPGSVRQMDARLRAVSEDWRSWTALIDGAPQRALLEMQRRWGTTAALLLGRAQCDDLLGVARTWYTLETNTDESEDRQSVWRATMAQMGGWTVREGAPWRRGELLAEALRRRCGVDTAAVASVFGLFGQRFGVRVDGANLGEGDAPVVGVLPRRAPPCLFLSPEGHRDRLVPRFAAAHELAHMVLAGRTARRDETWCCNSGNEQGAVDDEERLANAFAAYFLAPRKEVRSVAGDRPIAPSSPDFVELAMKVRAHFGLTAVTAGEHLLNCSGSGGVREPLSADTRERLRALAMESPTDFDSLDTVPRLDAATGRSEAFVSRLSRCVRTGVVSRVQAEEVLKSTAAA